MRNVESSPLEEFDIDRLRLILTALISKITVFEELVGTFPYMRERKSYLQLLETKENAIITLNRLQK